MKNLTQPIDQQNTTEIQKCEQCSDVCSIGCIVLKENNFPFVLYCRFTKIKVS